MLTLAERDEKCTCNHGGEGFEDHTEGNGCERRGCWCRFWPVEDEESGVNDEIEFINTTTRSQVTMWYSIHGVQPMESRAGTKILPTAAHFVFTDGDVSDVVVNGKIMKKDGTPSDRVVKIPTIWNWNQDEWPDWLKNLQDRCFADFAADRRAQRVPA